MKANSIMEWIWKAMNQWLTGQVRSHGEETSAIFQDGGKFKYI
jgi:hypothetical protein